MITIPKYMQSWVDVEGDTIKLRQTNGMDDAFKKILTDEFVKIKTEYDKKMKYQKEQRAKGIYINY